MSVSLFILQFNKHENVAAYYVRSYRWNAFFYIQSAYTLFSSINIAFLRPRGTVCTIFLILFENFFLRKMV